MKHLSTVSESCPKLAQWMVIIEALDRARCQRGPGRNDNVGLITTASAAPRMLLFFFGKPSKPHSHDIGHLPDLPSEPVLR